MMDAATNNTDIEIWREDAGDFCAAKLTMTQNGGGLGINVGGLCIVKPIAEWHALAKAELPNLKPQGEA